MAEYRTDTYINETETTKLEKLRHNIFIIKTEHNWRLTLGAIHTRRLLGGGSSDSWGQKSPILLNKKTTKGKAGVIELEKWADVVYGWPLTDTQNYSYLSLVILAHLKLGIVVAHYNWHRAFLVLNIFHAFHYWA